MKKQFLSFVLACAICAPMMAQEAEEARYDRSSLSIVGIQYGDQYDAFFNDVVSKYNTGAKFDKNEISCTVLVGIDSLNRQTGTDPISSLDQTAFATKEAAEMAEKANMGALNALFSVAKPNKALQEKIEKKLNEEKVGKQILAYVLNRKSDGSFDRSVIDARSKWNATDADFNEAGMMAVNKFGQDGERLVKNSYVIVYDMNQPVKKETKNEETGEIKITWSANVSAYVYAIKDAQQVVENVMHTMWIDDADAASVKSEKLAAWDNLTVDMECVAAVASSVSDKYLEIALSEAYEATMFKLVKKIAAWQVTAPTIEVRPRLTASIGKKEGIKNADRYAVYTNKFNKKTNAVEPKRLAYARATDVADNEKIADGEMPASKFYQISGMTLKKDNMYTLRQDNDFKIGFSLGGYLPFGMLKEDGSLGLTFNYVNLNVDYLAYIHNCGIKHYGKVAIGYGLQKAFNDGGEYFRAPGITTEQYAYGGWNGKTGEYKDKASYINFGVGYGIGLPASRYIDFVPFFLVGGDVNASVSLTDEQKKNYNTTGLYLNGGLRIVFNCGYPFQLFIQGDGGAVANVDAKKTYLGRQGYFINAGAGFKINL